MLLKDLKDEKLIQPPKWLIDSTFYLTIMGSKAYGVSGDDSDNDIYGFCIPPKRIVFPHTNGHILGFNDGELEKFEQWQHHHCTRDTLSKEKFVEYQQSDKKWLKYFGMVKTVNYDITVYNIVKYFELLTGNNPNIIDSIFTRKEDVVHSTQIAELIRENRKIFLNKKSYHTFKGYAFAQVNKLKTKNAESRWELIEKYGYDTKYAYHLVRLLDECSQILQEGDLDLKRNSEHLKAIRKGQLSEEQIYKYFDEKSLQLEKLYNESKVITHTPNLKAIKKLLLECLESHYGSLDKVIENPDKNSEIIRKIKELVND
jgi:predicted nucleotidyltransferase